MYPFTVEIYNVHSYVNVENASQAVDHKISRKFAYTYEYIFVYSCIHLLYKYTMYIHV